MLKTSMRRDGEQSRKRIITETRKEQNRIAAKAYRQRQKEKLQSLQQKSRGIQELRPRLPSLTKESISASHDDIHSEINGCQRQCATDSLFHNFVAPECSSTDPTARSGSRLEAGHLNSHHTLSPLVRASSFIGGSISNSMLNPDAYDLTVTQLPLISGGGGGNLNSSTTLDAAGCLDVTLYDTLPLIMSDLSSLETTSDVSNQNGFPGQDMQSGLLTFPNSIHEDPFQQQDLASFSQCRILEASNTPSIQSDSLLSHTIQNTTSLFPTPSLVADPFTNYIQLWPGSAFTAGLYIARSIGLNLEGIGSSDWRSPFYRLTTPADDPSALLAAARVPYAPANLQPTLPQILFPHHAYLDLIPFPVFRARAITLACTVPPLFDFWDLKNDINAGLVCWNPGNGTGAGNVQPWDVRSWKAAPWFLRKWRMLIG